MSVNQGSTFSRFWYGAASRQIPDLSLAERICTEQRRWNCLQKRERIMQGLCKRAYSDVLLLRPVMVGMRCCMLLMVKEEEDN